MLWFITSLTIVVISLRIVLLIWQLRSWFALHSTSADTSCRSQATWEGVWLCAQRSHVFDWSTFAIMKRLNKSCRSIELRPMRLSTKLPAELQVLMMALEKSAVHRWQLSSKTFEGLVRVSARIIATEIEEPSQFENESGYVLLSLTVRTERQHAFD